MKRRGEWRSALLIALGLWGCSSDAGGPRAVMAGVRVTDASGAIVAEVCARMPVLLGSVVEQKEDVGGAFAIELRAQRHRAEITFPGATNAATSARSLSVETLAAGVAETLSIAGSDGMTYSAVILTSCTVVDPDLDP